MLFRLVGRWAYLFLIKDIPVRYAESMFFKIAPPIAQERKGTRTFRTKVFQWISIVRNNFTWVQNTCNTKTRP